MKREISKARFEVSAEGMKGLHDGRPLWGLVKELVANVWDEPTATICKVSVRPSNGGNITAPIETIDVVVEDDGEGFSDVTDAYTLMAPTNKRTNSETRGRFNIGEKEIISIAKHAMVETVGTTIEFPEAGGREVRPNKRKKGTVVSARVNRPWSEVAETVDRLLEFLPPSDKAYTVNDETVLTPKKIDTVSNRSLPTIVSKDVGEPLRKLWRTCNVDIHEPIKDVGRIYEMGILIQEIEAPYSVNIQQKVPMPPNRDTVTATFLQDVYSIVLGSVAIDLEQDEASEAWVQMGVEDSYTSDETVEIVMRSKLGEAAVLWSSDLLANENAHADGMDLISPRTLSKIERERFKKVGLQSAHEGYGLKSVSGDDGFGQLKKIDPAKITSEMLVVEEWAKRISEALLGFRCDVQFVRMEGLGDARDAQYGGRELDFVYQRLGFKWFRPENREAQTSLILHELAHEGESKTPHTGEYVHRISDLGAKALTMAMEGKFPAYQAAKKERVGAM